MVDIAAKKTCKGCGVLGHAVSNCTKNPNIHEYCYKCEGINNLAATCLLTDGAWKTNMFNRRYKSLRENKPLVCAHGRPLNPNKLWQKDSVGWFSDGPRERVDWTKDELELRLKNKEAQWAIRQAGDFDAIAEKDAKAKFAKEPAAAQVAAAPARA